MELCSQFAFCSGDYFGSRVDGGVPGGCGGLGCVGRVRPRNARRQKLLWRKSGMYTFSSSPPPCNHLSFSIWGTVVKWLRWFERSEVRGLLKVRFSGPTMIRARCLRMRQLQLTITAYF